MPPMLLTLLAPPFVARLFGSAPARTRITRWFAACVHEGTARSIATPPGIVTVHCRQGESWITHDGDPRDVIVRAGERYVADTHSRMIVHAVKGDCVLEFEVAD
jgi:hypothetical protein